MVSFAPQDNLSNIPDWTKNSNPVQQPESDKSKGITLSTVGTGVAEGAGLINDAVEQNIKEKTRAGVDALRDTTTLAYDNIRNAQMTGQQPADAAMRTAGFTGSLLKGVGANIPTGLQAGIDQAGELGTALAQGSMSKANDTLYTGQLNALAKRLRSEYPGHKDFIDQEIGKISGKNPANAYMDNLLQDINRNAMAANAGKGKLLNEAYQLMGQGPDLQHSIWPYIKAYEMGLPGSEDNLASAVNQSRWKDYQYKTYQQNRDMKRGIQEDTAHDAKQHYQEELATAASRSFNQLIDIPGLSSPQTMQNLIDDQREGRISLTPQQHNQLLSAATSARDAFYRQGQFIARNRGYSKDINDPAAEKAILTNEAANFDNLVESVKNKEYGTMFEAKRNMDAIQTQTKQDLFNDPDMGDFWKTHAAVNDIGGPTFVNYLDSLGFQKGYLKNLQSFVSSSQKKMTLDPRSSDQVKSMYENIQQLQKAQKEGISVDPRAYHDVVHFVDLINDPKTPDKAKANIATNAFDERNFKTLDAFRMDFVDKDGKQHDGKYSVFDTLTQPGITDSLHKLGDTQVWSKYKNWAETSFAELYREDLHNLNSIEIGKSQTLGMPIRVTWDSDHNRLDFDDGNGQPLKPKQVSDVPRIQELYKIRDRLNGGIQNLAAIQSKDSTSPTETSAYLLRKMQEFGFDPSNTAGLPTDLQEAIKNSKGKRDLSTAFEKAKKPQ